MNNIHEMDWADERWHGHTGMDSASDYCFSGDEAGAAGDKPPEAGQEVTVGRQAPDQPREKSPSPQRRP